MKKRRTRTPIGRPRPPMKRKTALDIAGRFFRDRKPMAEALRDEIIATQMAAPERPGPEVIFSGWTTDEKLAFAADGTVPERYRK